MKVYLSIKSILTKFHDFWINIKAYKINGSCIYELKHVFLKHGRSIDKISFIFFYDPADDNKLTKFISYFYQA
jgi:hypothetical protein